MQTTTEPLSSSCAARHDETHPACFVCGQPSDGRLGLRFRSEADGSVSAEFACDALYQGYPDRLHGGIIAMLLDGGMTQWLFSRDIRGVTARLTVRFRKPVGLASPARIRAWLKRASPPAYLLAAELRQGKDVCVTAEGLFVSKPQPHEQ